MSTQSAPRRALFSIFGYISLSILIAAVVAFLATAAELTAQQSEHHHDSTAADDHASESLGTVIFPISCSPDVQKPFERAVALMHSFQYTQAKHGFEDVAAKDPHCAMAYWGEAMSLFHQLWYYPNPSELKQGHDELAKAEKLKPQSDREKLFIKAAAAYYDKDKKLTRDQRAQRYSDAMAVLYEKYPNDTEAATFYALSLLVYNADANDYANRRKAIAILDKVTQANPDHPGAFHYLIHASDRPTLAPLGLQAALRYAQIAPGSPHALHMPSHIFSRLGMWQESINSNLAAVAAAEKELKAHPGESHYELHPMDYLQYAYLQTGRDKEAWQVVENVDTVPGVDASDHDSFKAYFTARYYLEHHDWKSLAAMTMLPGLKGEHQDPVLYAQVIGAAHLGDVATARKGITEYEAIKDNHEKDSKTLDVAGQELVAWTDYASGEKDKAVSELRAAAQDEESKAPEIGAMPAREMLADMLLDMNQNAAALAEYEKSLQVSPNRFDSLYGAGHAAELAGKHEDEARYYSELLKLCAGSASDRPELTHAKTFLAASAPSPSPGH
jgi:hypothetical protein